MTPATVGIVLGAAIALCLGTGSRILALLAAAASLYLLLLLLVLTAPRPRRAAILCMAAVAATLTWTGLGVGSGLSVAELAPLAAVPLALVVSTFDLSGRTGRQWAALGIPVLMTLGGVLAAMAPAADPARLITFAVAAISLMCAVFVLRPDTGEVHLLLVGLISGVLVSTILGLTVLSSASGRSVGLTTHSNQYAIAAVMMLPLLAYLIRQGVVPWVAGSIAVFVLVAGIFQSGSRSGLLALAVVGLVMAYRFGGVYAAALYTFLGGVTYAGLADLPALAGLPAVARSTDSVATQGSDQERIQIMDRALATLLDGDYIIGTGFVGDALPHNIVLFLWAGFGLLGLIGFAWLAVMLIAPAFNRWSSPLSAALALGCLGFLTAVAFNNLVGASFFWLIAGVALFRIAEPQRRPHPAIDGFVTPSARDLSKSRGSSR